jgi:hypothetical protein
VSLLPTDMVIHFDSCRSCRRLIGSRLRLSKNEEINMHSTMSDVKPAPKLLGYETMLKP